MDIDPIDFYYLIKYSIYNLFIKLDIIIYKLLELLSKLISALICFFISQYLFYKFIKL